MKTHSVPILALAAALGLSTMGCYAPLPVVTYPAAAEPDTLRVAVAAQDPSGAANPLCERVAAASRQSLVNKGFKVESSESSDVRVALDVSCHEVNRAGDFILLEGEVRACASVPARDNRVLGEEVFKNRGARALGESAALDEVAKVLAPKVADWASRTVTADSTGIRAQNVIVSYAKAGVRRIPHLKTEFVHTVLSMQGVRSCVLVSETPPPSSTGTFRVVYEEGAFPAGLVNEIAEKNPSLNLRPGAPFSY